MLTRVVLPSFLKGGVGGGSDYHQTVEGRLTECTTPAPSLKKEGKPSIEKSDGLARERMLTRVVLPSFLKGGVGGGSDYHQTVEGRLTECTTPAPSLKKEGKPSIEKSDGLARERMLTRVVLPSFLKGGVGGGSDYHQTVEGRLTECTTPAPSLKKEGKPSIEKSDGLARSRVSTSVPARKQDRFGRCPSLTRRPSASR